MSDMNALVHREPEAITISEFVMCQAIAYTRNVLVVSHALARYKQSQLKRCIVNNPQ